MATQKPISTISYNSEAFLKEKLETWYNAHIIQAYQYILHKGEDGDKDHIHLRIEPNKRIDPMDLQEQLKEWTQDNPKPLGCRPFRPSVEEDWCLYAVHDETYLSSKYEADKGEKIPYEWQDIKANDGYDVETMYVRAKSKIKHTTSNLAKRLTEGGRAIDLIREGENPFVVNALARAFYSNDYERLQADYADICSRFEDLAAEHQKALDRLEALLDAIDNYGLYTEIDNKGRVVLSPVENAFKED